MSDSEDESDIQYVPFNQREEWKDVVPIPQDDGPHPVCVIAYTDQFSDTLNYFRAILKKDERSPRALEISKEVIALNPANYTAWYFRRNVLEALKSDLTEELAYVSKVGNSNPKNYQIWFHRRWVVEHLKDYSHELSYCAKQVEGDSKNYHAWAHRQWAIQMNGQWEGELDYISQLLTEDVRNNSAWNQRYFVITKNRAIPLTDDVIRREIDYAFSYMQKAPNNQSSWTYMKGLFLNRPYNSIPEFKQRIEEAKSKYVANAHAATLYLDILEKEATKESLEAADKVLDDLIKHLDTLHSKYWIWKKENVARLMQPQ
eukprot:TRINITY_DN11183_c0_g1_i1.p1 TRINITY_DN11183_c0_g1~~TRINITY_DN11183_c0_g1_i1.p1  ORF type:complete len:316 (+),score=92.87 TRINITY_DN11183_c0_g1_i1:11-958(+)